MVPEFDYSELKGRIRAKFGKQSDFAKAMGLSDTSISAKLNNLVSFSQREIHKAARILDIETHEIPAYFFIVVVKVA